MDWRKTRLADSVAEVISLLDKAKPKVSSTSRQLHNLQPFQLNWIHFRIIEQPQTTAKQHWHDINVQLIRQPGLYALPGGACRADDGHKFDYFYPFIIIDYSSRV